MVNEGLSRRKFLKRAGAAGAGLAGVSLAGCTTTQITANPTTTASAVTTMAPVSGGTIYYMTSEWPDDVDMRTGSVNACAKAVWQSVGDAFINFEPDFSPKGILVETWSHNAAYDVWTLNFREGVKFHNGADMTTHDFEGFLKAYSGAADYKGPKPFFQGVFKPKIKSWDVVDAYTINVNMVSPQFEFDRDLGNYPLYMIPYEQYMNPSQNTTVIGTGAYKFVEHVTRQYLTMEKNPDWWAAKAGLTKLDSFWYGTQYLDRIVTKWGAEDSVNLVALETGDTDVARLTYESTAQQAVLNPNLDVVFGGASRMMVVMANVRNAPFTDVRAREMILKAIDWTGVLAIAAQGLKPSLSMFQDSPYEHADVAQHVANYDAARAQALYTQLNSEGLLNRKIILANSVGEPSDKAAEFILTSIKTLLPNLNITVKNVDTATMQTFRKENIVYNPASPENHWDFCCNQGLPSGQESALTPVKNSFSKVSTYTSGPNATAGCPTCTTGNFAGYSDPQVETWITQASNDPVLANRVALLGQVENKVYDDYVYRPYCFAGQWYGLSKKVHGFQTSDVFKKGGFNWLDVWKEQ